MIALTVITGGRGSLPNDLDLVARMAAHLQKHGLPPSEREAVRTLMAGPFPWRQVARLAGAALLEARLGVTSEAMAQR